MFRRTPVFTIMLSMNDVEEKEKSGALLRLAIKISPEPI
jgi:hypothetical protein